MVLKENCLCENGRRERRKDRSNGKEGKQYNVSINLLTANLDVCPDAAGVKDGRWQGEGREGGETTLEMRTHLILYLTKE